MKLSDERALVTGASSGIGLECARLLAERGFDLVITARRKDRLDEVRDELSSRHGVDVHVIQNDLGVPQGAEELHAAVRELDRPVSLLINNAGFGTYGMVADQDLQTIQSMLQVNVTSLTTLARLFAADMRAQGGGRILNVSSFAALQPIPRYAVYSATKSYVVAFSLTLRHELRSSGVTVSVLTPGFTHTEFHTVSEHAQTKAMRALSLNARHVAKAGVNGALRGKAVIVPGILYKVNAVLLRFLPRTTACAISAAVVKSNGT
jgi:hypothetical protein